MQQAFEKVWLLLVAAFLLAACATAATLPPPTPTAAPPTATPAPDLGPALDAVVANLADQGFFAGSVLVARDGEVLLSKGYGLADRDKQIANTPQTKFRLASISKQFTAMAIMILENQGKLDVQASVCTYIPDCPNTWQPITLHMLLSHMSGIADSVNVTKSVPAGATPIEHGVFLFRDEPLQDEPGSTFIYSTTGYMLLAYVVEQVSGQMFEAFLRANIFEPLGMAGSGMLENLDGLAVSYANSYAVTAINPPLDYGLYSGGGGLFSTTEDLLRWDQALYTDTLLPKAALDRMFTPWVPANDYGYGWWLTTSKGRRVVGHTGQNAGASTQIDRYVDDHVVVIVLSNQADGNAPFVAGLLTSTIFAP